MKYEDILKAKKTDLNKNFKCIGRGSSRYVYDAGDGKTVIKYAMKNGKGVGQNETEYELYEYVSECIGILCPVLDISGDNSILIMAKAAPINKIKGLSEKAKKTIKKFKEQLLLIEEYYRSPKNPFPTEKSSQYGNNLTDKQIKAIKRSSLFQDICTLTLNYDMLSGDLFKTSSWGYYKGKIVLIDYGCSRDCFNKYYRRSYKACG